jgi:hypothetical protein
VRGVNVFIHGCGEAEEKVLNLRGRKKTNSEQTNILLQEVQVAQGMYELLE